MKREEINQLVEDGLHELNSALAKGNSDRLKEYLGTMAKFPCYSLNNILLINSQYAAAELVMGFHSWRKLGRNVKKGEKGIGIMAPLVSRDNDDDERRLFGFKVVHVFDISQTEGKPLPELAVVSGDPGHCVTAIEQLIQSEGIELAYEAMEGSALGVSQKGRIVIAPDLDIALRFCVLAHELAHEKMHAQPERRSESTKTIRETEAQAVAHVVCDAIGLQSVEHSADYIRLYDGDVNVLVNSITLIQKTASEIISGIKDHAERLEKALAA